MLPSNIFQIFKYAFTFFFFNIPIPNIIKVPITAIVNNIV